MGAIDSVVLAISNILYQPWCVPLILIGGAIYLTFRCGFLQIGMFREACKVIMEKPHEGGVSSFGALMVSTASRVGTGNIIGVSTAIVCGGPGAIFWMWITAFFGGASAFVESTLAQIYKRKDDDGTFKGGPAFYMRDALGQKWLGVIFSIFIIFASLLGALMYAATGSCFLGLYSIGPLLCNAVLASKPEMMIPALLIFTISSNILGASLSPISAANMFAAGFLDVPVTDIIKRCTLPAVVAFVVSAVASLIIY